MINQSTIDKLIEMHLTAMSDTFRNQLVDIKMKEVSFEDRFARLIDIEYSNRKNNRLKRLIMNAQFDQQDASIKDIDYLSGRKLNRELITRLATCEYIAQNIGTSSLPVQPEAVKHICLCLWNGGMQAVLCYKICETSRYSN